MPRVRHAPCKAEARTQADACRGRRNPQRRFPGVALAQAHSVARLNGSD